MYKDPIIRKIMFFYNSNKLLSFFLIANLILFGLLREKFYVIFFFLYLLYFAGALFARKLNNVQFIYAYIIGFFAGAGLFFTWRNTAFAFPDNELFSAAIQSAIICVLSVITAYAPNVIFNVIFARIKLKYITTALIIINLLSVNVPSLYLAHLGSVAAGLFYGFIIKNTFEQRWGDFFGFFRSMPFRKPKMKAEYNRSRPLSDDEYNAIKVDKQKKIDEILDKISKSGYDNLSKEDKDFLFNSTKN